MITLLSELSEPYELNRKTVPPGKFDDQILARLAKSADRDVRTLASMARLLKFLKYIHMGQVEKVERIIDEQAKKVPNIIRDRLIETLYKDDSEIARIRDAAKTVEEMMGKKLQKNDKKHQKYERPQTAVNEAWAISCLGNGLGVAMREKLRAIATQEKPPMSAPRNAISVALATDRSRLGTIIVANRTSRTLHHCLIIGRLEADRKRLEAMSAREKAVGGFILPSLGFSMETVAGSLLASELRTIYGQQDKGMMLYVPEIPPRATICAFLERADYFLISKGADVSLCCDELTIDRQPVRNWKEALSAVQLALRIPSRGPRR
jgi:hypothetical protein